MRVESLPACMFKSYHEGDCEVYVWRHVFFTIPMTPVMGGDERVHGSEMEVMTGFTLVLLEKTINWRHDFNHTCGTFTTKEMRVLICGEERRR